MAVVLQGSNGGGNKKGPVSSLIAYGIVGVFGIAVICMTLFGGPKADPMDKDYSYNKYNDLADMAFSDDAAEAELLASGNYNDIAKNDLINALFSKEDKENRIKEDMVNGAPPPPDAEYAEAAQKKEEKKQARERYNRARRTYAGSGRSGGKRQATSKNSLSSRGGVSFSNGGGSGVSRSVWRDDETKDKYSNNPAAAVASSVKGGYKSAGRSGLAIAYNKSKEAAGNKDLEAAARQASEAFHNGIETSNIDGDLEKDLAELDLGAKMGELDKEKKGLAASNLDKKLAEAKEKKDREKQDLKCDGVYMGGQYNGMCAMSKLLDAGMEFGKSALNSLLSKKNDGKSAVEAAKTELELEQQKQITAEKEKAKTEANNEKTKAEEEKNSAAQKLSEDSQKFFQCQSQGGKNCTPPNSNAAVAAEQKFNQAKTKAETAETEYNNSKQRENQLGAKKTCLENGGSVKKCGKLVTSAS